jgi:hypothetical protein
MVVRLTGDATGYLEMLERARTQSVDQADKIGKPVGKIGEDWKNVGRALQQTVGLSGRAGAEIAGPLNVAKQASGSFLSVVGSLGGSFVSMGMHALTATGVIGLLTTVFGVLASAIGAVISFFGIFLAPLVAAAVPLLALVGAFAVLTVGVLAFLAVGAGLLGFLSHLGTEGARGIMEMRRLSLQIGVTTEQAAALSVTGEHLGHALFHMSHATAQLTGQGHGAAMALQKLNIAVEDFTAANTNQQIRMIAASFANLTSQTDKAAVARALFGRGGVEMIDLLSRGTAGLDAQAEKARRFGLSMTQAETDMVRQALISWNQIGQAFEGIKRQLAVAFAPLWDMLGEVGGDIGERIVGWVRESVPFFHDLWQLLGFIGKAIKDVGTDLYGSLLRQLGMSSLSFEDLRSAASRALYYIEFGLRNIGPIFSWLADQGELLWNRFKLAALEVIQTIRNSLREELRSEISNLAPSWLGGVGRAASAAMNVVVPGSAAAIGAASTALQAGGSVEATNRLDRSITDMRASVDRLRTSTDAEGRRLASMANAFVEDAARTRSWANAALRAASPEVQAGVSGAPGKQRTVAGTEATLAGSERAFTILFSNQGTQEQMMRAQLQSQNDGNILLRSIDNRLALAPVVRSAG